MLESIQRGTGEGGLSGEMISELRPECCHSKPEEGFGAECVMHKNSMCQGPEAGKHLTHFLLMGREQKETRK